MLVGCAYPRRATLVHSAPASAEPQEVPDHLWSIRFIDAHIPDAKGSGLPWDGDGSAPDPYLRLVLDGRVVWETPVQRDTRDPKWNITLPRNVYITSRTKFRLELWDSDTASSDPAGAIIRSGLPESALPNALAHLTLDNLAIVTVVVSPALPARGLGVEFEQHDDALWVLSVEAFSPAARAGVQVGDRIVAIGDVRVESLSAARAASELSLSSDRGATLTVADSSGKSRHLTLSRGDYLWLTM
jgi:hypothetical protein